MFLGTTGGTLGLTEMFGRIGETLVPTGAFGATGGTLGPTETMLGRIAVTLVPTGALGTTGGTLGLTEMFGRIADTLVPTGTMLIPSLGELGDTLSLTGGTLRLACKAGDRVDLALRRPSSATLPARRRQTKSLSTLVFQCLSFLRVLVAP